MFNDPNFKCECGSKKFGHYYDDYGQDFDYCLICNKMYLEDGTEIQEDEPPEYDPDDPDNERNIKEA